jgi:hypothetical protein
MKKMQADESKPGTIDWLAVPSNQGAQLTNINKINNPVSFELGNNKNEKKIIEINFDPKLLLQN